MAGVRKKENDQQKNKKSIFANKTVRNLTIILSIILFLLIVYFTIRGYQKHFVNSLKISEEVFLSQPQLISLENPVSNASNNDPNPLGICYSFNINGYTFSIPEKFTPSKIDFSSAEFREKSKLGSKYIYLCAEPKTATINLKGIYKWFLPKEMRYFFPMVLNSTIHPIRLMFKAQLFANEGITSKIFKANWDKNHTGYIFPTLDNEGYYARIFRMDNINGGTVEFVVSDSIRSVKFQDYINLAKRIKMSDLTLVNIQDLREKESLYLLDDLIEQASNESQQCKTLSIGLNEFFRTRNAEWLIPVAIVMQDRGFFPEVLDLIADYKSEFDAESKYYSKWNEILDNAVAESVAIEIDPLVNLKEINVYCKNLTDFDIKQVQLDLNFTNNIGHTKGFNVSLFSQSSLLSKNEKKIIVKCPSEISLSNLVDIKYRVTKLEFARR